MKLKSSPSDYGSISQTLHWLTAIFVVALLIMGKAGDIEADEPGNALFMWHASIGVLVMALVIARVLWRLLNTPPRLPIHMSAAERWLARAAHGAFYLLLVALPVTGWLVASTEGAAIDFFGIASLPTWQVQGEESEELFEELHETLGNALLILASVHALAALKHHFFDRDDVLTRMLPFVKIRRATPGL